MRPIIKGSCPKDSHGRALVFTDYRNAHGELIKRLGQYCSYCEMKIGASLAVEHIQPIHTEGVSSDIQERKESWDNFLLACTNCNSIKGNNDVVLDEYFWPHRDNTFLALTYAEGGVITPSAQLSTELKRKARNTITLTGLDRNPLHDSKKSDRRWENRREVWNIACDAKADLFRHDTSVLRKRIVSEAIGHGFWSVWMRVFQDDPDMCKRLINAFPGTCSDCFDEQKAYLPIQRSTGKI